MGTIRTIYCDARKWSEGDGMTDDNFRENEMKKTCRYCFWMGVGFCLAVEAVLIVAMQLANILHIHIRVVDL